MVDETGCNGVMIGRAAISRPWIFREILNGKAANPNEVFETIDMHICLMEKYYGDKYTLKHIRKFLMKYLKGMRGAKQIFQPIYKCKDVPELLFLLNNFHKSISQ